MLLYCFFAVIPIIFIFPRRIHRAKIFNAFKCNIGKPFNLILFILINQNPIQKCHNNIESFFVWSCCILSCFRIQSICIAFQTGIAYDCIKCVFSYNYETLSTQTSSLNFILSAINCKTYFFTAFRICRIILIFKYEISYFFSICF